MLYRIDQGSAIQPEHVKEDAAQLQTTDNPDESPATTVDTDEGGNVTGLKLAVIIIAITMAGFLVLLDTSIVATVSTSAVVHRFVLMTIGSSTDHE
jgi:nucleoside permease NupC